MPNFLLFDVFRRMLKIPGENPAIFDLIIAMQNVKLRVDFDYSEKSSMIETAKFCSCAFNWEPREVINGQSHLPYDVIR